MNRPLVVEPEAAAELEEAVQWYERRSVGLGLEFARLIRAVLAVIERTPMQFPEAAPGNRRAGSRAAEPQRCMQQTAELMIARAARSISFGCS